MNRNEYLGGESVGRVAMLWTGSRGRGDGPGGLPRSNTHDGNRFDLRGRVLVAAALLWVGAWLAGSVPWAIVGGAAAQPPGGMPGPPGGMMPGMGGMPGAGAAQAPEATPLPDAITAWRVEHFKQARSEGHPKFILAVQLLGRQFAGTNYRSDRAATLLAKLLKSESPSGAGGSSGMGGGMMGGMMGGPPAGMGGGMMGMAGMGGGAAGAAKPLGALAIRVIVDALGVNRSNTAHKTIGQVLSGTLLNDSDAVAAEAALEVLLKYSDAEYEKVLMTILVSPGMIRPNPQGAEATAGTGAPSGMAGGYSGGMMPGMAGMAGMAGMGGSQGRLTAADLQSKAMALIEKLGSDTLRMKLAELAVNPGTPPEARAVLLRTLTAPSAKNLAAQLKVYGGAAVEPATKQTLQQGFAMYSSMAIATLMGVPKPTAPTPANPAGGIPGMSGTAGGPPAGMMMPPGTSGGPSAAMMAGMMGGMTGGYAGSAAGGAASPGGLSPEAWKTLLATTSDQDLFRASGRLWSAPFCDSLSSDLKTIDTLDAKLWSVLTASTIPSDQMRMSLRTALTRRFSDGPRALDQAGVGSRFFTEPGFLVVMKSLPRKDPSGGAAKRPPVPPRSGRTGSQPGQPGQPGQPAQPAVDLNQPDYAWFGASERLSRFMCQQFQLVGAKNAGDGAQDLVTGRPIKLSDKWTVQGECHIQWPEVATGMGAVDAVVQSPMTVHFVRVQCELAPRLVIAGFKRQLSRAAERSTDQGYWFDGLLEAPDGRKRSIDVWIMRASDVSKAATATPPGGGPGGMSGGYGATGGGPGGMLGAPAGMSGGMSGGYGGQPGAGNRLHSNDGQPTQLVIDVLSVDVNNLGMEPAKAAPKKSQKSAESE